MIPATWTITAGWAVILSLPLIWPLLVTASVGMFSTRKEVQ